METVDESMASLTVWPPADECFADGGRFPWLHFGEHSFNVVFGSHGLYNTAVTTIPKDNPIWSPTRRK